MIGVVLAGGVSRRMGQPKAGVEIDGVTMAEYVRRALAAVCRDVVASGGPAAGLEIVADPDGFLHRGPVVGIASVLNTVGEPILAVGVDQPWVRVETLAELAAQTRDLPVVPVDAGARQVTCAVYTPSFLAAALSARSEGSIQSALDEAPHDAVLDWDSWGEDGRSWYSANSEDSLKDGLDRFGRPSGGIR